jgi:hypothetical protein
MNLPVNDYDAMRDISIKVDWTALITSLETGALPILSYSLEWDQAADSWISLVGESTPYTGLTYTVSDGVQPGELTKFRLRAQNAHGWGPYSDVMEAVTSWIPSQPLAVVVTIENIYVKLRWY